jgi:hypothetical protein
MEEGDALLRLREQVTVQAVARELGPEIAREVVGERARPAGARGSSGANTDRRRTVEPLRKPPARRKLLRGLVAWDGVEPPTRGFSVRCSTS